MTTTRSQLAQQFRHRGGLRTLAANLELANAGTAITLRVAHQAHRDPQDAPAATVAPTRESAAPGSTLPRYGGSPALDAGLPIQAMIEKAVSSMFGLSPTRPGGR